MIFRVAGPALALLAMAGVVVASNVLVQYPVEGAVGGIQLADLLTWGAFTYPLAFLVTDLTNRRFGPNAARSVVLVGFVLAVVLSVFMATPRIALASGTAFLLAQMLDVSIFNRLRALQWWKAPVVSSVLGSVVDTLLFFTLAFAVFITPILGFGDDFATEQAPLLGVLDIEAPRWLSWALGDFAVKILAALTLLAPYRLVMAFLAPMSLAAPSRG